VVHQQRGQLDRSHHDRRGCFELQGTGIDQPGGITVGSDGALWFTNSGNNSIGRITTSGVVSNFTAGGIVNPGPITTGPGNALWFANYGGDSIGRITTSGVVTMYTSSKIDGVMGITAGPDSALWLTNYDNDTIGKITTAGVVTDYSAPGIDIHHPVEITAGPDGALWFTNSAADLIGRITTAGVVTDYFVPHTGTEITTGPDGALWFTSEGIYIGRITTSGVVTVYTNPTISQPHGIASGSDGNLWFTNQQNNSTGRITAVSVSVSPDSGAPGTSVVASGRGYAPGEQVNVTYLTGGGTHLTVAVCNASADSDGAFSCSGNVPTTNAGTVGKHTIKAKGVTLHASASTTFTLT